jgi:hypothetical protein
MKTSYRYLFLISLLVLLCSLMSCAMPNIYQAKVSFPVPFGGFSYPPQPPSPEEEGGIVLRYKPYFNETLNYSDQTIHFMRISGDQGQKMVLNHDDSITFSPAEEKDCFIKKTIFKCEELSSTASSTYLISSRGNTLKCISEDTSSMVKIKTDSITEDALFPADIVRIGDIWTQNSRIIGSGSALFVEFKSDYIVKIRWRLSGFATVRNRRCAILEGISECANAGTKNIKIHSKARHVKYFDYKMGVDVESIESSTSVSTIGKPYPGRHTDMTQRRISLLEKESP